MRITQGTVVDGKIVVPEEPLDERTFTLSQEDEIALLEPIQEAERGGLVDGRELLNRLP